jgi:hypothetical protein
MDSLHPLDNPSLSSTSNVTATPATNAADQLTTLSTQLRTGSEKTQLQAVQDLAALGEAGLSVLMAFLLEQKTRLLGLNDGASAANSRLVAGKAYQVLFSTPTSTATDFLQVHFPNGIVPLQSAAGIDYSDLQKLLADQYFQAADQMTLHKLCELAGPQAVQRKWVYFTEVERFPIPDLQTINALWLAHSEGKFGFSVQRELWLSVGKNWEKLWDKIAWKSGNNWTRYPQEFIWDLSAPKGHLPLSNQLRGVRPFASLLVHPAWNSLT